MVSGLLNVGAHIFRGFVRRGETESGHFCQNCRSQSTGRAEAESDIDVVVISDDFRIKNIFRRIELIKKAEIQTIRKFMVPLDIITMTQEEYENKTSLIAEYAQEGELLYAS